MLKAIEGIFRNGKVELLEQPPADVAEARVLVTFLPAQSGVSLPERGIDEIHAAGLRRRLVAFAEEWDRPEMDVYNEW